ncbi:MAG: ribonuclease P protein component [Bacteroidota bacterium]|nr:ribonuclease P protein component [Bacteroidota bacterium]
MKAHERLKSRKVIQQLFEKGKTFSCFPFRILYLKTEKQLSPLQSAFSVSTRHFKKSVDRNRIKRLMRESYRLQKNNLQALLEQNHENLAVFFIYTGLELPEYELVFNKIGKAIRQVEKQLI